MSIDPSRLYATLQNTGLQRKDNPLYQVIHDLIGITTSLSPSSPSFSGGGSSSSTVINTNVFQLMNPMSDNDNNDNNNDMFGNPLGNSNHPSFTQGSVIFAGSSGSLAQDNANFYWDDINNILRIGPIGAGGNVSLDVVSNLDAGISFSSTAASGRELFLAGFLKDSSLNYQKVGAFSWQFIDNDHTNGFASYNEHASWMNAGVQTDEYGLVHWGNNGIAFFPPNILAATAPGPGRFIIYGDTIDTVRMFLTTRDVSKTISLKMIGGVGYFGTETANDFTIGVGGSDKLHILATTGNIGLGLISPAAVLHLKAGTATGNTAPLKFTAGTSLTIPESGTIEYDGTDFFLTP